MFAIFASVVQVKNSKVARASISKTNCVKATGKRIARNSTKPPNDSSSCTNEVTCEVVKIKFNLASVISLFFPCIIAARLISKISYPVAPTKIVNYKRNFTN